MPKKKTKRNPGKPAARRIDKTARACSEKLSPELYRELEELFKAYGNCLDGFYKRFSGIRSMVDVLAWETVRNKVRSEQNAILTERKATQKPKKQSGQHHVKKQAEQRAGNSVSTTADKNPDCEKKKQTPWLHSGGKKTLMEIYGIQGRHYVMACKQACMNLNSMWANLSNKLKCMVRDNDNLTDDMKSFCYYALSVRPIWQQILLRKELAINGKKASATLETLMYALTEEEICHCRNYIRRITRKHKPQPRVHHARCMLLDQEMYEIREEKDTKGKTITILSFMSATSGKRYDVVLRGPYCYKRTGDIQLVLNEEKRCVEIHKAIKARVRKQTFKVKKLGVDKGYATLLSCSSGREYGEGFGEMATKEAERINKRNTERNRYIQEKKELDEQIKILNRRIAWMDSRSRIRLIRVKKKLEEQIQHLETHHLGNRKYKKEHRKVSATMETELNHQIRLMLKEEAPEILGKEDLSFTKDKVTRREGESWQSAGTRRKLSSWTKGILDERLEYLCGTMGIRTKDVNPAYTSQFCPHCGAPLFGRGGIHHATTNCPNCGTLNANTSAAKLILQRMDDEEITLYTKYKTVKEIMIGRYEAKHPKT